MSDFDRIEESRERSEGLAYEEWHERRSAEDEEGVVREDEEESPDDREEDELG